MNYQIGLELTLKSGVVSNSQRSRKKSRNEKLIFVSILTLATLTGFVFKKNPKGGETKNIDCQYGRGTAIPSLAVIDVKTVPSRVVAVVGHIDKDKIHQGCPYFKRS